MMKPFRERNPVTIGAAGLVAIALFMLAAFRAEDLPLIGGGDTYYAQFSEAGGLKVNDEVRVAGVRVGHVEDITLDDGHVLVAFRIDKGTDFGTDTGASIRVKTLLGSMYLALEPSGTGQLEPGSQIPLERTAAPYDVVQAFSGLANTERRIKTGQLATSLNTLAGLFRNTPDEVKASLTGLSRLSRNVAARDEQLNTLLTNASKLSKVLADRNQNLEQLFKDGNVLLRAVYQRREAVHNLLVSTTELSRQLTGLVADTRSDLKPALDHLDNVVDLLNDRQEQLDDSLRLMAPFYRVFANTLGTGPWFDTFVQNLPPVPSIAGTATGGD
jgi:phospholipid/cholesterol/gamma-HCH transport system substrate-binding protein